MNLGMRFLHMTNLHIFKREEFHPNVKDVRNGASAAINHHHEIEDILEGNLECRRDDTSRVEHTRNIRRPAKIKKIKL